MSHTSATVIPRWEWRTFATSLSDLRHRLNGVAFEAPRESQETYLLCLESAHNVKIREGQLDLKWRRQVGAEGLELWDPVFKSGIPIESALLPRLAEAWGIPLPAPSRPSYRLNEFLAEIVEPSPALVSVRTAKRREAFNLDGVPCEFARIVADGIALESFCVAHEDPSLVLRVVRSLSLDSHHNINYPMGLKKALAL